jgi:glycosyltransferase involved in cell wall biosynthesis
VKILYQHRIGSKDGQVVHIEELVSAFRALGNDVLLVGPASFDEKAFGYEPRLLQVLKRVIPGFGYELLEILYNGISYRRLSAAVSTFRPDFIYERYNLFQTAGIWAKWRWQLPLILEVNAPLARERGAYGGLKLRYLATRFERYIWRKADYVIAVTRVLADEIIAAGIDSRRVVVVANAIDPEKFGSAPSADIAKARIGLSGKIVLGFCGFARDWHGLDAALEILKNPNTPENAHLLVVGAGPAIEILKEKALADGMTNRVTFMGLVERNEVAGVVAAFDIALLPSCVDYCSPLKLFEYMALSKPTVAPDQANIREILTSGTNALLFPPNDRLRFAEAIEQLVKSSESRIAFGQAARAALERGGHTWRENAGRTLALVQPLGHEQ